MDEPVSSQELNRVITEVVNRDPVGEYVVVLARARILWLVLGFHTHLYAFSDFGDHQIKIRKFYNISVQANRRHFVDVKIESSWKHKLGDEFSKPYFQDLAAFVKSEYRSQQVYPPGKRIFSAFEHCSFPQVKVVILGQDPYHGSGQANGLCFSVADEVRMPPSLINIFKEIQEDIGTPVPPNGNLERWADQGVLLLNATLTVRAHQAGSHQGKGWETFTDSVIQIISDQKEGVVFMLWGAYAQKKGSIIDRNRHLVLSSPHPSPFSADRGFFGNKHFSQANTYLMERGEAPIAW